MNFDDMKSAWQQDSGGDIELPDQLETIKKAKSPVQKVKKNIRMEMWGYLILTILFFILPFLSQRLIPQTQVFYYTILILTLLPMIFYFYNFYKFYGRLNQLELNTKENVEDAYFDLRYSIEIYTVMQHFTIPNFMLLGFVFGVGKAIEGLLEKLFDFGGLALNEKALLLGFGLILLLILIGGFYLTRILVRATYGKYLNELKEIRESLKEGV